MIVIVMRMVVLDVLMKMKIIMMIVMLMMMMRMMMMMMVMMIVMMITRHTSHAMRHMSHVTRNMSLFTRHWLAAVASESALPILMTPTSLPQVCDLRFAIRGLRFAFCRSHFAVLGACELQIAV